MNYLPFVVAMLAVPLLGCGPGDDPDTDAEIPPPDVFEAPASADDTLNADTPEAAPDTMPEPARDTLEVGDDTADEEPPAEDPDFEPEPSASAPQPSAEPEAILQRVEQAYEPVRTLRADFQQVLQVPLLGSDRESEGTLYQERPNRLAMRFSDPEGDLIVADGQYLWIYQPSSDETQVLRSRLEGGAGPLDFHEQFIRNATERFTATHEGEETVNGRTTDMLTLVPNADVGYRQVRIWVDREDSLVRRFEIEEDNDSVRRIELRDLALNAEIDDAVFEFEPPEGTQVFDQ